MIPDLVNLFLSGFIFMTTFNWLNNRKMNVSILTVWSLFISILVQAICSFVHSAVFKQISFNNPAKILIYSSIGFTVALLFTYLRSTKLIQQLIYFVNNKSINDDIFDDVIDYEKRTMMVIYLKSSDIYYLGRFALREEKGLNSWILLVDYYRLDKTKNDVIYDPDKDQMHSSVLINLNDVESIHIIYEKDSKTWKRFTIKEK